MGADEPLRVGSSLFQRHCHSTRTTFPDVFTPMGFFGAGPQSSAWLYLAWRSGLSIALLVYAFPTTDESMEHASDHSPQAAIIWAVLIIIVGVGALTWVATAGQDLLPRLMWRAEFRR